MRLSRLAPLAVGLALVASSAPASTYRGTWFSGTGTGDAADWLSLLETARSQLSPNPLLQDVSQLYNPVWDGFVEGPTWGAWWTANSYGTTVNLVAFAPEPYRSFIRNSGLLWWRAIGDGVRVGLDSPEPAPVGCLCDAAEPGGAYYKQGDGNVPIHDWALEESLAGVVMEAERLLVDRDAAASAGYYLPLMNQTLALIESRRNATNNLFYSGDASNYLAPSYGAWLLPNGTRAPAFLTGMSVSYIGALDRVIELEKLVGGPTWSANAAVHAQQRDLALAGLSALVAPDLGGNAYFVRFMDPDGTLHGVLNATKHAYIDAVVNHDAVFLGVADRVSPGFSDRIMATMLGPAIPANPLTGGPGLRPFDLVIANAPSLDDMEISADSSWLWNFGTWVNGGEWAECEGRMMLAYALTNRSAYALDSMRALMGYASIFRMDSPLTSFGSQVYQPSEPINIVYDMFAIPAALIRGLWNPSYAADALTLRPAVSGNFSALSMNFPLLWGGHRLFLSTTGNASDPAGIASVTVNGTALSTFTPSTVTLAWAALPETPANLSIVISYPAAAANGQEEGKAAAASAASAAASAPLIPVPLAAGDANLPAKSRAAAVRALRGLLPAGVALWLEADTLALSDKSPVAAWPDSSGTGNAGAAQANATLRPTFSKTGMNGNPTVVFDGRQTFLQGALTLPPLATVIAVFNDAGETNLCCTGIFYSAPGCAGLGTKLGASPGTTAIMIDWSGSGDTGSDDVTNRQVVASVVYNASGGYSFADGCLESTEPGVAIPAPGGSTFMVGSRNNEDQRFFNGALSELLVFPRALNDTEREAVEAYLSAKWPRPAKPLSCGGAPPNCTLPEELTDADARLGRFVGGMRAAGFADGRYELAHALLALDSTAAWETRCAGLNNGTIDPLPTKAGNTAASALYVSTALNLATGLATVLNGYSNATDPDLVKIYGVWEASA